MMPQEWLAEVRRRIEISEGCSLTRYFDSVGVPTIAYGYNLDRGAFPLLACGITNAQAVIDGTASITQEQADAILAYDLPAYITEASLSLPSNIFNRLSDARRFVIVDLVYNMGGGPTGWGGFTATQNLIAAAVDTKNMATAHALYGEAADHLAATLWALQVGNRALRDIAMMRSSTWVDANGDGTS